MSSLVNRDGFGKAFCKHFGLSGNSVLADFYPDEEFNNETNIILNIKVMIRENDIHAIEKILNEAESK